MKDDSAETAWKKRALESEAALARVSRQLSREMRVIQVLVTLGAVKQDHVDKAREMVDELSN